LNINIDQELELRAELEGRASKETFEQNYLVEAGAGAGKSTTMVRRIANLLLNKVCEPEQLVAITFTVKATQELREKLEQELRETLSKDPDNPELQALVESAERIQVSTIDSFCRTLLTTMPFSNPLGMAFEMRTDNKELGSDFFSRRFREDAQSFGELCDRFAIGYNQLKDTFLLCCGNGDYEPSYLGQNNLLIQSIETTDLPKAARSMKAGVTAILDEFPSLRDAIYPEFLAIMSRPDQDFDWGKDGLEALIPYIRSRSDSMWSGKRDLRGPEYNSIMSEEAWRSLAGKAIALRDALNKSVEDAKKKPNVDYTALRNTLRGIIASQGAEFIDKDVKKQIDSTVDFSKDADALKAFKKLANGASASRWLGSFDGKSLKLMTTLRDVIYPIERENPKDKRNPVLKDNAFSALLAPLLHSAVLEKLAPLVTKFQAEKEKRGVAIFNDVLILARNMLRDNKAARAYFRNRYRCYFVDEFQDTDAVQTELLFYLTSEEENFFAGDWKRCVPRPGSLFLVGDPKQAIYRFRGADIDTYTQVYDLFCQSKGKVGVFKKLSFNFRSTKEICAFTEKVFKPLLTRSASGKNYQAAYEDMLAVHNVKQRVNGEDVSKVCERADDPNSIILAYQTVEDADCEAVASFIRSAIDRGAAQAKDFLILTDMRQDSNYYAKALLNRGVPANISGRELFSKTPAIAGAVIYLGYLLDQENPVRLQLLLEKCYSVKPETVLRLKQRGKLNNITAVFYTADSDVRKWTRLDALTAALQAEDPADEELLALCAALHEIRLFRQISVSTPAVSVLERLFSDVACLWPSEDLLLNRRRSYARVQQFMDLLRTEQMRDFSGLARRAVALAEEEVEAELPLELGDNCVRVMNVHKAKGLQGEIVILAYHKPRKNPPPMLSCREVSPTGEPLFHVCIAAKSEKYRHTRVLAWEGGWAAHSAEESRYLSAERERLLYVAATRAQRMLLVNTCASWAPIHLQIEDPNSKDPRSLLRPKGSLDWLSDRAENATDDAERAMLAALAELYPDNTDSILKLLYPKPVQDDDEDKDDPAPIPVTAVEPDVLAQKRQTLIEKYASPTSIAITPSCLEHKYRPAADALVSKGDPEDAPAEADPDAAANDTVPPDSSDLPDPKSASPRGKYWGTIVHRIMELAVSRQQYDGPSLRRFAEQAAFETLHDIPLGERDRRLLCCPDGADEAAMIAATADAAAEAAAFLNDSASPLRKLLAQGRSYTELPFVLRAEDANSALYQHISAHLANRPEQALPLDVNGSIDLAILCGDGRWIIVDYKTDVLAATEDEAAFRARLTSEYTPQIAAYAKVLEALNSGTVAGAYLCSIPLGGALIALPLGAANAPTAQSANPPAAPPVSMPAASPVAAAQSPSGAVHPVSRLLTGRSFSPTLGDAAGATGFTLHQNGQPVTLIDKHGAARESFKMCRDFSLGVSGWVRAHWPDADASVDFTNAGSVVVLRRTLRMLKKALPADVWEALEITWKK